MRNFFDFFVVGAATPDQPLPEDDWQHTSHRPTYIREPQPSVAPKPTHTAQVIKVKRPQPEPVRYGDPPHKALAA